jgi:phytoene synthase
MNAFTISHLIGSSDNLAFADDALKDEDNAAWVMTLPTDVRMEWIERIRWIRLVDRLAERAYITGDRSELQAFHSGWNHLLCTGRILPGCAYQDLLANMQKRWFNSSMAVQPGAIQAWNTYLKAIERYHTHHLCVKTLARLETMLIQLAGSFFQILPLLPEPYWQAAAHLGAVDQFYNNLRDLREDAEQGICYLPAEVLDQFGLSQVEILTGEAIARSRYRQLMQFWLDDYLPQLWHRAAPLIQATDLPTSWTILRDWSLQRYQRIEQIFRVCEFDYQQFPDRYWTAVKQDLPRLLLQAQHQAGAASTATQPALDPVTAAQLEYATADPWLPLCCLPAVSPLMPSSLNLLAAKIPIAPSGASFWQATQSRPRFRSFSVTNGRRSDAIALASACPSDNDS